MFYTSRSAVEAYNNCHRLRYLEYLINGTGIVPKQRSVPLVSGTAVHRGAEVLLNAARIYPETGRVPDVDHAVSEAIKIYDAEVVEAGFSGKAMQSDRQQWFTYCEQKALVEALVRIWHLRELPRILERYKILAAEREIEPLPLGDSILWQSRVDAELQEIASSDYHNYSLKTVGMWNDKSERSYKSDLQGITEIWGVEQDNKIARACWEQMKELSWEIINRKVGGKQMLNIFEYLGRIKPPERKVMGVRFCFLVKGARRKETPSDENSLVVTDSPLIRGYKKFMPGEIALAHSYYFPNPNNKSGRGALGAGWEKFNVWETDITIKQWITILESQELQPECGDVIAQHVITPPEYFRDDNEIAEAMEEIRLMEELISISIRRYEEGKWTEQEMLNHIFPHNRAHCYWHFGDECPYVPVCWDSTVSSDIIGSGLYQIRVSHHEPERKEIERQNAPRG